MKKWTFSSWLKGAKCLQSPHLTSSLFIEAGEVSLRYPQRCDGETLMVARFRSKEALAPWEPDINIIDIWNENTSSKQWSEQFRWLKKGYRSGHLVPFVILLNGDVVGQIILTKIERASINYATLGYWVDSAVVGQGVATAAVALAIDYGWDHLDLHRIQATVHPDNEASKAVLHKVGMQKEGLLRGFFKIQGELSSHELWALLVDDDPVGATDRVVRAGRASFWKN